jgi:hypothetical protein
LRYQRPIPCSLLEGLFPASEIGYILREGALMKLVGDDQGIAVLKAIRQSRPDYLKFLITEARSSTLAFVEFFSDDEQKYLLKFRARTGQLVVEKME